MTDPTDKGFTVEGLLSSLSGFLHQMSEISAQRQRGDAASGAKEKPVVDSRMTIRTLDGEPVEASFFGFTVKDEDGEAEESGEPAPRPADFREPPVDIMVLDASISAVVEVPGADPDSIEIALDGDMLTIKARGVRVEYHCEAMLPVEVDPHTQAMTMRNGILELSWRRPKPPSKSK
ncbi:MAG: Hsp20/alpha crystallin family protein [Devosia sp.]